MFLLVGDISAVRIGAAPGATDGLQMIGQVGGVTRAVAAQGGYVYVASGLRLLIQQVTTNGMALTIGSSRPFSHFALGVAVKGRYAYVAAGSAGLRIIDVSDPENPTEVGAWDSPGYAESVAIEGNTAYVADGPYGLRAVDVSDAASPRPLGTAFKANYAFDVAVEARRAYVASAGVGLLIADFTEPSNPTELATLDTPGYAYGVAFRDGMVYVADGWEGLRVVDATDPAHPVTVGGCKPLGWVFDVAVSGDYAYLASAYGGVRVIDISHPAQSREIAAIEVTHEPGSEGPDLPPGRVASVAVDGSRLYAAERKSGLMAVDISVPTRPVRLGAAPPSDIAGLPCEGAVTRLYGLGVISGREDGTFRPELTVTRAELVKMLIVALGATAPPTLAGSSPIFKDVPADHWAAPYVAAATTAGITSGYPDGTFRPSQVVRADEAVTMALRAVNRRPTTGAALSDYLALAADLGLTDGLGLVPDAGMARGKAAMLLDRMFYDVPDRSSGRTLAESRHALAVEGKLGWADSVAVQGRYAYVAAGAYGFAVIDLADPSRPVQVGSYPINSFSTAVAVNGRYAYVASNSGDEQGLHVFDISHSDRPNRIAFYWANWISAPQDLAIDGDRAYIPDERGLEILSLADPTKLRRLGYIELWDSQKYSTTGVAASGDYAYVVANSGGLYVIDVADPANPKMRAHYEAGSYGPTRASLQGNLVYLLGTGRVEAVNVTDPVHPRLSAGLSLPNDAFGGVEATAAGIYLAGGTKGLTLVKNEGASISSAGSFDTLGSALDVAVDGDLIAVADAQNGLVVLTKGTATGSLGGQGTTWGTPKPMLTNEAARTLPAAMALAVSYSAPVPEVHSGTWSTFNGPNVRTASLGPSTGLEVIRRVVTTTADNGPGTLRSYLEDASPGLVITFDPTVFPKENPAVIAVESALPELRGGFVTIDGRGAGVILDGSKILKGDQFVIPDGLRASSEGNVIKGLEIRNFPGHGIFLANGWRNTVGGLLPGEGNVLYGNGWHGITMLGQRAFGNIVVGNYSGTDRTGAAAPGNRGHGISMEMGAWGNLVQGNLCSGNDRVGINIGDEGSNFNTIIGNIVGTDVTGTRALPNKQAGIFASYSGASFNRIGGTAPGEGNLVSGNPHGVYVEGPGSEGNLILGNHFGTTLSGSGTVGTPAYKGIAVGSSVHTMIGGVSAAEGNVVARASGGVYVDGDFNFVLGNRITLGAGDEPAGSGIFIQGQHNWAQGNVIGGTLDNGVQVDTGGQNTIRRNLLSGYRNKAIDLRNGGNSGAAAPVISEVTAASVSGTAEPGALIEVYTVGGDGAVYFEGETVAGTGGSFSFAGAGGFRGPRIECLATYPTGDTSESASWTAP